MTFTAPWWLLGLLVVPLAAVAYVVVERRDARYAVRFSNVDVLASVASPRGAWRRHVPAVLLLAAVAVLLVAVARPRRVVQVPSDRAAVVLVVDVSGSMRADDVSPTRLRAAQAAVHRFAEAAPAALRVGLVAFSNEPQVVVVPTTDRTQLLQGADSLRPQLGTAIGDAIARAVELARSTTASRTVVRDRSGRPLASVLLLSDGAQTRGVLTPGQGADRARRAGIPVYTVALGTQNGVILGGPLGLAQELVPVPPDPETLAAIAQYTNGRAYEARTAGQLERVYAGLGSKLGRVPRTREMTVAFVALGALLAAAALGTGVLGAPRLP